MNRIREWFHRQWQPVEQADKAREFQAGGVVEPPEETELERLARKAKEREAACVVRNKCILEAWRNPDNIRLTKIGIAFTGGRHQEWFADDVAKQKMRKIFDKPHQHFYLFRPCDSKPTRVQCRNEIVVAVAEFPGNYVLFDGKPMLVPKE